MDLEVKEIEVFIYLNRELIFVRNSSIRPLQRINFKAKIRSVYHNSNSAGYRNTNDTLDGNVLPSQMGQLWNPSNAILQQITKQARLDIDHLIKTSSMALSASGEAAETEINISLDSSQIEERRDPYISDLFFAFFVEYVYFSVAIYSIFVVIGDSLFQNTFKSIVKIQK